MREAERPARLVAAEGIWARCRRFARRPQIAYPTGISDYQDRLPFGTSLAGSSRRAPAPEAKRRCGQAWQAAQWAQTEARSPADSRRSELPATRTASLFSFPLSLPHFHLPSRCGKTDWPILCARIASQGSLPAFSFAGKIPAEFPGDKMDVP